MASRHTRPGLVSDENLLERLSKTERILEDNVFTLLSTMLRTSQTVAGLEKQVQTSENRIMQQQATIIDKLLSIERLAHNVHALRPTSSPTQAAEAPSGVNDVAWSTEPDAIKAKVDKEAAIRIEDDADKEVALEKTKVQIPARASSRKPLPPAPAHVVFCNEGMLYENHVYDTNYRTLGRGYVVCVVESVELEEPVHVALHFFGRKGSKQAFTEQIINSEVTARVHGLRGEMALICWTLRHGFSYAVSFEQSTMQELLKVFTDCGVNIVDNKLATPLPSLSSSELAFHPLDNPEITYENTPLPIRTAQEQSNVYRPPSRNICTADGFRIRQPKGFKIPNPFGVPLPTGENASNQSRNTTQKTSENPSLTIKSKSMKVPASTDDSLQPPSQTRDSTQKKSVETLVKATATDIPPSKSIHTSVCTYGNSSSIDQTQKTAQKKRANAFENVCPYQLHVPVHSNESSSAQTQKNNELERAMPNVTFQPTPTPAPTDESLSPAGETPKTTQAKGGRVGKLANTVAEASGDARPTLSPVQATQTQTATAQKASTTALIVARQKPQTDQEIGPVPIWARPSTTTTASGQTVTFSFGNADQEPYHFCFEQTPLQPLHVAENSRPPAALMPNDAKESERVFRKTRVRLFCFLEGKWHETATGTFAICENSNGLRLIMVEDVTRKVCLDHALTKGMKFQKSNDIRSMQWGVMDCSSGEPMPRFFMMQFGSCRKRSAMLTTIATLQKDMTVASDLVERSAPMTRDLLEDLPDDVMSAPVEIDRKTSKPKQALVYGSEPIQMKKLGKSVAWLNHQEKPRLQQGLKFQSRHKHSLNDCIVQTIKSKGKPPGVETDAPPAQHLESSSPSRTATSDDLRSENLEGSATSQGASTAATASNNDATVKTPGEKHQLNIFDEAPRIKETEEDRNSVTSNDFLPTEGVDVPAASPSLTDGESRTKVRQSNIAAGALLAAPPKSGNLEDAATDSEDISQLQRMLSIEGELRVMDGKTGEWQHHATGTLHVVRCVNARTRVVMLDDKMQVRCKHFIEALTQVRLLSVTVASWAALDFARRFALPTLFSFEAKSQTDIEDFKEIIDSVVKFEIRLKGKKNSQNTLYRTGLEDSDSTSGRDRYLDIEPPWFCESLVKYIAPSTEQVIFLDFKARLYVYCFESCAWNEICDLACLKISRFGAIACITAEYKEPKYPNGLLACSHQITGYMSLRSAHGLPDNVSWDAFDSLYDEEKMTTFAYVAYSSNERLEFKKIITREELRHRRAQD